MYSLPPMNGKPSLTAPSTEIGLWLSHPESLNVEITRWFAWSDVHAKGGARRSVRIPYILIRQYWVTGITQYRILPEGNRGCT